MANTNTKQKKAVSKTPAKAPVKTPAPSTKNDVVEPVVEKKVVRYKAKTDLDPSSYVVVRNGFHGTLVYKSKKTGERFVWREFGDEQEMELSELKSAKSSYKSFFINNWFLFDDPEVIEWLGVGQYYKYALDLDAFDKLFKKEPGEIEKIISGLSKGQKKTLAYRAKQLINDGVIDSIKAINTLEKSLSVELIER